MNYYEHHIRDYDAATAHLTWDQDMAYMRLIRWYYRKEKPIPAELAEACRQVRATSKVQKQAVAEVLSEFFTLREDGWHNETCDQVIASFQAGEPEREAKKKNEEARLNRHRRERAELFSAINAAGLHLHWNAPIAEVRELAERVRSQNAPKQETPETEPATAPATPATATHTPVPNTQYPDTSSSKTQIPAAASQPSPPGAAAEAPPPLPADAERAKALAARFDKLEAGRGHEKKTAPQHPDVVAWVKAGVTDPEFREAFELAAFRRQQAGDPSPINPKYLLSFINEIVQQRGGGSVVTAMPRPVKTCCGPDACQGSIVGEVSGRPYCREHQDYAMDASNFRRSAVA